MRIYQINLHTRCTKTYDKEKKGDYPFLPQIGLFHFCFQKIFLLFRFQGFHCLLAAALKHRFPFRNSRALQPQRLTEIIQIPARKTVEFGRTYVVKPKRKHQATIVWLHGLGDNGSSWSQLLESLPLPNIKWICPTAPTRPVAILGGFPCTAWFDAGELSEDCPEDIEGLDTSAAHIANLLSTEPADVKLGIGGFSNGAATALYSATCFAHGKYSNGCPYSINLGAVVALSGWLPLARSLRNKIEGSHDATVRATYLPILLCHGLCDEVVPHKHGERSFHTLSLAGFRNLAFRSYQGMGHYTVPKEMEEVCKWLNNRLGF